MYHRRLICTALVLAFFFWGCQRAAESPPKAKSTRKAGAAKSDAGRMLEPHPPVGDNQREPPPAVKLKPQSQPSAEPVKPPAPLSIPNVVLSEELRATCLVGVGDVFPTAQLPDLNGNLKTLNEQYGPKLTVICFWTIGSTHRSELVAEAVLRDLAKKVAEPFGSQGVVVCGVNVGDSSERVRQLVERTKAPFPILSDFDGTLYAKVATERKMPRTFLLDREGRILWFDVEYSRSAWHDLIQGIQAALSKAE